MGVDPAALAAGSMVGPYVIARRLGAGGAGVVYAAEAMDGQKVALKVLDVVATSATELARFQREYNALTELHHPNVVRVFRTGRDGNLAWLAMELVTGDDLEAVIARWRAGDRAERFAVGRRVLAAIGSALEAVHARGLVHRDIKPANILIDEDGTPKLADFGIVKGTESSSLVTHVGRIIGTVAYLAPEMLADDVADARTDLYGLGAVLYTILTLRRPIEADSLAGYLARHLTEPPPPPREVEADVPPDLERVCLALLHKQRELRPASASELLRGLADPARLGGPLLFGREALDRAAVDAIGRLGRGLGTVLWLVGPPGAGRTAAIERIRWIADRLGRRAARLGEGPIETDVVWADDLGQQPTAIRVRWEEAARAVGRGALRVVVAAVEPSAVRSLKLAAGAEVLHDLEPLDRRAAAALLRARGVAPAEAAALARRLPSSPADGAPVGRGAAPASPSGAASVGGAGAPTSGRAPGGHGVLPGALVEQFDALVAAGVLTLRADGQWSAPEPDRLADEDLPPPQRVRVEVLSRLATMDPDARELVEVLAVFGRPVGAGLAARAVQRSAHVPVVLDQLVGSGFLVTEPGDDDHALRFARPGAGVVVRAAMAADVRVARHLAVATALQRQRGREASTGEIARHLAAAGRFDEAGPLFARAATQHLKAGRASEALRITDAGIGQCGTPGAPGTACEELLRLRGRALLSLRRWDEAVDVLRVAADAAERSQQPAALLEALSDLGGAMHRQADFGSALGVLERVLTMAEPGAPLFERATRVIADIDLHRADYARAEAALRAAVARAERTRRPEDEARARRSMANVNTLRGDFVEAARELEAAEDLLTSDSDPSVRAGVLARLVELDLAAGRYGVAAQRGDVLVDLCRSRGLSVQLPEALALAAQAAQRVGSTAEAVSLARSALAAQPRSDELGVISALRVLIDARAWRPDQPLPTLRGIERFADLIDPEGQMIALRARTLAVVDPAQSAALSRVALARPAPRLLLAQAAMRCDAAIALVESGNLAEGHAATEGLDRVDHPRADGLRLDVWVVRASVGDPNASAHVARLARSIADRLVPRMRESFLARPEIAAAFR